MNRISTLYERIDDVFNTLPRDGNRKGTVWLERKEIERKLQSDIGARGVHLCIDGPTGTGKSSLATTILNRMQVPFRLIQVTKSMTWTDFCYRIIKPPRNKTSSFQATVELGVSKGLPTALLNLAVGTKHSGITDQELRTKIGATITEDVLCELMAEKNVTLLIDDFERASGQIVQRVSDMCKLLTQSYISKHAKLVIVGTDDIYSRLTRINRSLDERLLEISIGTFSSKLDSWNFLRMGFDKIGLENPAGLARRGHVSKADLSRCVEAVHEAVNGLPKSLNSLGRAISMNAREHRKRISVHDILNTSLNVPKKNIRKFSARYPEVLIAAKRDPVIRDVLSYLYKIGIGQIHRLGDVVQKLDAKISEQQIRSAIGELIKTGYLTQTGFNNDILFVTDPAFAHTLGVIVAYPEKYEAPKQFRENQTLLLPWFSDLGDTS